ncbi:MAG: periplasmic polysaccharide biosynthesis/export protein [Desulfobulbaceae bacterium BRH_c16a]|nr:MAG: periplasmic polysaccharide biosynthesis/export protein [Desulfobulbaceae bacterium BRH_c16a]
MAGCKNLIALCAALLVFSGGYIALAQDYLVGPGDVLSITVYDNDDLKTKVRVSSDGAIVMPLLGQVNVNKLSISAITEKITGLLADGYIVNPQVNVFVDEFRSKKVVVLGNVNKPGLIELSGPTTFLELISKAGGFDKDAGDTATIKRKGTGQENVIVINLISLVRGGDLTQNMQINDEDTVYITRAGMCYVTGEVGTPGTYPCGEGATVLKLVALAKGFTGKASKSGIDIVRMDGDKKNIIKDVSLDTPVRHNDVIVVPESFF